MQSDGRKTESEEVEGKLLTARKLWALVNFEKVYTRTKKKEHKQRRTGRAAVSRKTETAITLFGQLI